MIVGDNIKITPNMDLYSKNMNEIKERMEIFKDLKEYQKIGKDDETGEYYIVDYDWFQQIKRWWWSENREKTTEYIKNEFIRVAEFLDMVYNDLNEYSNKFLILDFIKGYVFIFIDDIIPGLHSLKKTYENYSPITSEVDSFILKMLEFKEKINRKKERPDKPKLIHL